MAKIYTRSGDDGTTGLVGGKRLRKSSPRIDAYGSVDELNAVLGLARTEGLPADIDHLLDRLQDELFTIGALLALPEGVDGARWSIPKVESAQIEDLERAIDRAETELEPLRLFILPGGARSAAALHLARTVARRAERAAVALADEETVDGNVLRYLNRLSDLLFVLARLANHRAAIEEVHPSFGKAR